MKDHRKMFCPAVFLWIHFDEGQILNTPLARLEFYMSPYIFPNTVGLSFITALLEEFILSGWLKKEKQCRLKDCIFNIYYSKSIKVDGEINWYAKYLLPHLTLSFACNYKWLLPYICRTLKQWILTLTVTSFIFHIIWYKLPNFMFSLICHQLKHMYTVDKYFSIPSN